MKKTFLFTDNNRPGKFKRESRTHPPKSTGEGFLMAIIPEALLEEEPDWLNILEVQVTEKHPVQAVDQDGNLVFEPREVPVYDDEGNLIGTEIIQAPVYLRNQNGEIIYQDVPTGEVRFEVVIDQAKKDEILLEREVERDRNEADDHLESMVSGALDTRSAVEALILGDSEILDKARTAYLFKSYAMYEREKDVMAGARKLIVKKPDNTLEIKVFSAKERVAGHLGAAPSGFNPGDERFLSLAPDGKTVVVDWDARLGKFKTSEKSSEEKRKKDEWNSKRPLERIKDAFSRKKP